MVPNGWDVQSIDSFCKVSSSKRIMQSDYVKEGVPFYRSKEIILKSKGIEPADIIYIDVDKFERLKDKFGAPEEGDILISAVGTLGKCYLVKKGEKFYFKDGNLLWLRELRGVEQLYLIQFMQSPNFQNEIQNMTGGSSQKALTIIKLAQMNLPLPPLPEQRKIAQILSTWDKAISTTERLIDNSKQQKKALMQELLTGKKRLLDDSGKPFEGEWEETKLNSVLDLMRSGLSRKLENENVGIAVIRSNNMGMKYTNNIDLKYWFLDDPQGAKVENYILNEGDLLVNFINSISQIGKACIYKQYDKTNAIYTTNILRIKANPNKIDPIFLFLLTQTKKYNSYVKSITKPAVNQASFTTKEFGNFIFQLPAINEQKKIAKVLINADREIELLVQQLADLKQEKKGLMQQLLTGKRRVKVDDTEVA